MQHRRIAAAALVAPLALAVSGCGWLRSDETSFVVTTTTVADQMRPVPTIPAEGGAAPVAAPVGEVMEPPSTELVGDPQPDPESRDTLPALPGAPVVDACVRLGELATADAIGAAVGVQVAVESIGDQACRFASGAVTAEVHYLPEGVIESDWFRRAGIQPVGAVTGDAVGLARFQPPGSASRAGYTIAMVSRREGAVIAVRGSADDRMLAEQVATIVDSST